VRVPYAQVAETHSAVVFFAGDRACKLKKPVNLGFLDFTTLQARAVACAREAELNRRYAPDVYLGVGEVRGPDGTVYDHLVVMRRMPSSRRLSALVQAKAPVAGAVDAEALELGDVAAVDRVRIGPADHFEHDLVSVLVCLRPAADHGEVERGQVPVPVGGQHLKQPAWR